MNRRTAEQTPTHSCENDSTSLSRRHLLKTGAGAVTTMVALPAVSGVAAAHFHGPDKGALSIDVLPDSQKNPINPNSEGVVPVAVLQSETFDPTKENVNYRFGAHEVVANGGGARPVHDGHVQDVDGDGKSDLLLHFPMEDTGFDGDEVVGHLHWEEGHKGAHHGLGGSDTITIRGSGQDSQHSTETSPTISGYIAQLLRIN